MLSARNDKSGTHNTDTFGSRNDLMLSFSTAWNSGRHTAGDEMLREIKVELGFDRIELGHGIRISLMPGIQKMFEAGEVTFSSLHNFCPLPVEVLHASPDCYQFSTPWGTEAERAVKQTFQTIDFAERLGAPFVVLHCGEVRMNPITDELIALVKRLVMERRISVLFTEHSMDVVFAYADRIIVLARGIVIAEGDAKVIRDNPQVQQVYLGTGRTFTPHVEGRV